MIQQIDHTKVPPFGMNGLAGLSQNEYYWCRHADGSRFVAKLENNSWWIVGGAFAVDISRDQVICQIKAPEN
jgi:hypothetical protein